MKPWTVIWSYSINEVDFEMNSNIVADNATQAVKKFMCLLLKKFPELSFEEQEFRAEKNHSFFVFRIKNNIMQRI
jgi:hypothetical protein